MNILYDFGGKIRRAENTRVTISTWDIQFLLRKSKIRSITNHGLSKLINFVSPLGGTNGVRREISITQTRLSRITFNGTSREEKKGLLSKNNKQKNKIEIDQKYDNTWVRKLIRFTRFTLSGPVPPSIFIGLTRGTFGCPPLAVTSRITMRTKRISQLCPQNLDGIDQCLVFLLFF